MVTPACTKRFGEGKHSGVQARPLAGLSPLGRKLGATGFARGAPREFFGNLILQ
jgi:hypothetical protein